jgi:branched-chain amino acid transport system substrate-binding protein
MNCRLPIADCRLPMRPSTPDRRSFTKPSLSFLFGALCLWAAAAAGYEEKVEPQKIQKDDGYMGLPANPQTPLPGTNSVGEAQYPYYGNTPEEMLPYKGIQPFHQYWLTRLPFRGPGRDYPDPPDLKTLRVGLLTAANYGPEGARGQRTRKGVLLAFEEENAQRKAGQLPFEVFEREDSPQWGSSANISVQFKDADCLGYLGTIDGDATHVALRVTLKIETYMINTSDPDPTLTETQVPWLTRIFPDDRQQCWRLAYLAIKEHGCKRVAVLRESSRPGRVGVMHFINYIRRLGCPAVAHLLYKAGSKDLDEQLKTIKAAEPDAVLFYGQPEDIGYAVSLSRKAGLKAKFFGFDRLKEESFTKAAGQFAEGMTITYFWNPDRPDKPWVDFVQRFQKRWGKKPDVYAAYGYDGAKLMIEAVNHAGPNRFRVRDYLANLDEWDGVTGHMIFDGRWDNIVPISVAHYTQGKWHFQPFPELKRPDQTKLTQK